MGSQYDMIVVGTGWHGLVAAKTYLELHPAEEMLVLEARDSCGGTWAADRLYPGLKTNNLLDTYEYPDFPMSPEVYGIQPGEHIPGPVVHRYLTDFAKKFGVYSRIQFSTKVDSLEPTQSGGWTLKTSGANGSQTLQTKKIIIATGLTSQANLPNYPGADSFGAPIFHGMDFYKHKDTVNTARNAVVVGGAKSAMDVCYAYASSGVQVDMVIRPTGNGPIWIAPPYVMGGKRLEKLLNVRWMTWFSPCPWGGEDGWGWVRRFLHGTWLGRFLANQFWAGLSGEVITANKFDSHPELKKLQPWNPAFWTASGLSIHNYPQDLFEMVKQGKVRVHIATVDHLSDHTVYLSDGTQLKADALCCATGWIKDPTIRFSNFGDAGIGLAGSPADQAKRSAATDKELLTLYPRLADQPTLRYTPKADPFRLYRFMVPPARYADRNIAFAGMVSSVSTATCANAQALWISAYLDGRLAREPKSEEEIAHEVMLHTQWGKWRYPCGYGANLPDFAFDALPYVDLLLADLGLKVNRKEGWFKEISEPYSPRDFVGLVDEWTGNKTG